MADNYKLTVICDTQKALEEAIRLAFTISNKYEKPSHPTSALFWLEKEGRLIFYAHGNGEAENAANRNRFPVPLGVEAVILMTKEWLAQQKYPNEPGHDGSNQKGFLLTTNGPDPQTAEYGTSVWYTNGFLLGSIFSVGPHWCWYGK